MVRYVNGPTPGSAADLQDDADPEQVARTILLRRLTAAPRARAELHEDLRARGIPDDVADRVLDRFVEVGLVDDEQYARMWVESRQRSRGTARSLLRQELRQKGVADDIVAGALDQVDEAAESERGAELVRRRIPALARYDAPTRTRRLVSMLVRRGYRQGQAFSIVSAVLAEAGMSGVDDDAGLQER